MIVFQSFLAIADIHPSDTNINSHQLLIMPSDGQSHLVQSHSVLRDAQYLRGDIAHNDGHSEEEPDCHHGHCHHASVVFIVKASELLALTRQSNSVKENIALFISPNISPDLRPPIS